MSIKSDINKLVLDKKVNKDLGPALVRPPIRSSNIIIRQEKSVIGPEKDPITGSVTVADPSATAGSGSGIAPGLPTGSGAGSGVNTGDRVSVDADDLINGLDGPQFPDVTSDATTNTSRPLGNITGLKDCATGQNVNLHMNSKFPVPVGWENGPPPDSSWELGFYWYAISTFFRPYTQSASLAITAKLWADFSNATNDGWTYVATGYDVDLRTIELTRTEPGGLVEVFPADPAFKIECVPSASNVICPLFAPTETKWPTDGAYDLAFINGQFVTSPLDTEVPAGADIPSSAINLCTSLDVPITIEAATNNGYMVRPVTGGTTFVYNSDGTLRGAGDNTASFNNSFRPREK